MKLKNHPSLKSVFKLIGRKKLFCYISPDFLPNNYYKKLTSLHLITMAGKIYFTF